MLQLPGLREMLAGDVKAALHGDPATASPDEIIFSYPGLMAVTVYRMAHALLHLEVPLLPPDDGRIRPRQDRHRHPPGRPRSAAGFFIDHGTGLVIGSTAVIGDQCPALPGGNPGGAVAWPRRHRWSELRTAASATRPLRTSVVVYAGATILGGETTIGARSVIGGNVWLTESGAARTAR